MTEAQSTGGLDMISAPRKRAPEEFQAAARERSITFWLMHECTFCDYPCGYVIQGDQVLYDNGCNCLTALRPLNRRSWEDLAGHYNMQTSPEYIAKMDAFWGFDD